MLLKYSGVFLLLGVLVLGGCPLVSSTGNPRIPGGDGTDVQSDSSTSGAIDSSPPAFDTGTPGQPTASGREVDGFADALTVQFPGCEEPEQVAYWRSEIMRMVNEERAREGVAPVQHNRILEDQATQYACEMISGSFFGHSNPVTGSTLSERTQDFGYVYWIVGENLAGGQLDPASAMDGWMNSPGHRENILNPAFTELGVGIRVGGEYNVYWVQEFGRPQTEPHHNTLE